jgi:tetratricopeptide (TPR) repeat protein
LLLVILTLFLQTTASADTAPDAQAHLSAGQTAFERGAFDTAIESWALAALASERAGDRAGQIQALVHASEAYAMLGRYRQAVGVLDQALKLAESSADRSQVPWILSRLGNLLIATGPADAAETALTRALGMARESGDTALTVGC